MQITGIAFVAAGIVLGLIASQVKGPVGGRYSGKQPADGSRNRGPRPGLEAISVVRLRWIIVTLAILCVLAGTGFQIAAIK